MAYNTLSVGTDRSGGRTPTTTPRRRQAAEFHRLKDLTQRALRGLGSKLAAAFVPCICAYLLLGSCQGEGEGGLESCHAIFPNQSSHAPELSRMLARSCRALLYKIPSGKFSGCGGDLFRSACPTEVGR